MCFERLLKQVVTLLCLTALFLILPLQTTSFADNFSPAMIRKVSAAVKLLVTDEGGDRIGQGTGFFVSSNGHMLTNYHVVEESRKIMILEGKKGYEVTRILAYDKDADIALLETRYPRSNIRYLPLRETMIELGESIMVLGYPKAFQLGTTITLTKGNVSSVRPVGADIFVQFTAAVAGGSSGSPIIDENGEVAGIVSSELKLGQGMFLGLSSPSILRYIARHIPSGGRAFATTPNPQKPKQIPLPEVDTTSVTVQEIREAQRILNKLGFKAGTVDGKVGSQTVSAMKAFQSDRGVPQDGVLSRTTLEMLRFAESARGERRARQEVPGAASLPRSITAKDGSVLLLVPAGEFVMGESRRVNLSAYYIGKYNVTNEQYAKFVSETGHRPPAPMQDEWRRRWAKAIWKGTWYPPELAEHPVVNVSWEDAMAYAKWAGCELPTEAQWEKAARGPNRYGMEQQAGLLVEWCYDWFDPDYYQHPGVAFNPRGPVVGRGRVLRGNSGDHIIPPVFLGSFSATQRSSGHGDERWYCIGFRLARTMR